MTNGQSHVEETGSAPASPLPIEVLRQRARARRHGDRLKEESWNVVLARRQKLRMVAVCAGALLLMGLGVYYGVSHQNSPPPESVAPAAAVGTIIT